MESDRLSPHIRVATLILRADFGEAVEAVGLRLLTEGCTLPELQRSTRLPTQQLKNALLALIQHNIVRRFGPPRLARPSTSFSPTS